MFKSEAMSRPDVLSMIRREMNKRHTTSAALSRGLNMNPTSIHGMLNRQTIQVNKLIELSDFFQYNFFKEIAAKIPYPEPDYSLMVDWSKTETLQKRVSELEMEVSILRQTLKDVVSR